MDTKKVVWSEGMFLSPQHFQQQERYLESFTKQTVEQLDPNRFGLSELELDLSLPKIGKIGVKHAKGVFPDGTPFEFSKALVLDIPKGITNKLIYLAIPVYRAGVVNIGEGQHTRYVPFDHQVFDTSRDLSEPVQLEMANLNICLKLEGDELQDYTLLAIGHISEHKSEGEVLLNRAFVPTCLQFGVSEFLSEGVSEIYAQMQYRAQTIANRLQADSGSKSYQALIRDYMWLQAIGGWLPKVRHWVNTGAMSTQSLYLELISMIGQMQGLEGRMPQEFPAWNQTALYAIFSQAFAEIQVLLREVQLDSVTSLVWDEKLFESRRLLRTLVPERGLFNNGRFVMVVTSSIGGVLLSEQFPQAAKLSGNSDIADLVRNALSGVPLRSLPVPPSELKARTDAAYFEVDQQSELWQKMVKKDEPIALHIDERMGNVSVEFYVIR
ncbi:type VI secretion system baseplate subunit TssK [Thaumasiovibrio subtropicus]|uniref:type VI secretion system baseplate subunit TssK n=1 Tax=Thaumasiovibrio subtropicus TaxID=1891207 RepID=UPI000B35D76E|nr:type VI secretion system baseplate subunit TssK [Thaumasiovibrio subtropicus]